MNNLFSRYRKEFIIGAIIAAFLIIMGAVITVTSVQSGESLSSAIQILIVMVVVGITFGACFAAIAISKKKEKEETATTSYPSFSTNEPEESKSQTETQDEEKDSRGGYVVAGIISALIILISIIDAMDRLEETGRFPVLSSCIGIGIGAGLFVIYTLTTKKKIKLKLPDTNKYVPMLLQPLLLAGIVGVFDGLLWGWATGSGLGEAALWGFILLFGIAFILSLSDIPLIRKHGWKSRNIKQASEEKNKAVWVIGYTAFLIGLLVWITRWASS